MWITWRWRSARVSSHDDRYIRALRCSHCRVCGEQVCTVCCICDSLWMDHPFGLCNGSGLSWGFIPACRIMCLLWDLMPRILCQVRRCWASSVTREGSQGEDGRHSTALTYEIKDKSYQRCMNKNTIESKKIPQSTKWNIQVSCFVQKQKIFSLLS